MEKIILGVGLAGFRNGGKHLVLTRGRQNRSMRFREMDKVSGKKVTIVAIVDSKSAEESEP